MRLLTGGVAPLVLDQLTDAVRIVGFVGEHNGARTDMVEQRVGDLPVVGLPSCQAEPDRETLRIDDDV
jgi:hypothetical protein